MKKAMAQEKPPKAQFIEAVVRDYSKMDNETWTFSVISTSEKASIFENEFVGEGSNPFVVFRWSNRPGEVYGRGPAVQALPAARVANLITKLTMENADIQIGGMWQIDDDGTVNTDTIQIASGTVIPRVPGTAGMESIQPGGRLEFGDLLLSRAQDHIREIFFNENLGQLDKTPISATEAAIRTNRLAESMGSGYGRMLYEFVVPVLRRVTYLMKRAGEIEMPRINGREISVVSTSPLARGMKFEQVQNITNFMGTVQQLYGPEKAGMFTKDAEIISDLAGHFEIPAKMLTTEEERKQGAAQIGEAIGMAEAQSPGSGADVVDLASRLA